MKSIILWWGRVRISQLREPASRQSQNIITLILLPDFPNCGYLGNKIHNLCLYQINVMVINHLISIVYIKEMQLY